MEYVVSQMEARSNIAQVGGCWRRVMAAKCWRGVAGEWRAAAGGTRRLQGCKVSGKRRAIGSRWRRHAATSDASWVAASGGWRLASWPASGGGGLLWRSVRAGGGASRTAGRQVTGGGGWRALGGNKQRLAAGRARCDEGRFTS